MNNETIRFHLYTGDSTPSQKKPLFLYLEGSGAEPLFRKSSMGVRNTLFIGPSDAGEQYYYVVISKPEVPFVVEGNFKVPQKYYDLLSRPYRAEAASAVIDYMIEKGWADKTKIVVAGISEGAQVAPLVAQMNKNVTHIGMFSGGGLTQMFDFIVNLRKAVRRGELGTGEAEKETEKLYAKFKEIYSDPKSTTKVWLGHTYLRWSSFFEPPLEPLLKLTIPIYIAVNTEDTNGSIESSDIIPLEFIRHGKTNLTYRENWNCDHFFNCRQYTYGMLRTVGRRKEVITEFMSWLNESKRNP